MEDFVTYEQAVKLKELGFKEECFYFYDKNKKFGGSSIDSGDEPIIIETDNFKDDWNFLDTTSAPTLSQAQKWLREKGLVIIPCVTYIEDIMKYEFYIAGEPIDLFDDSECYDTYEEALLAGIDRALELLK